MKFLGNRPLPLTTSRERWRHHCSRRSCCLDANIHTGEVVANSGRVQPRFLRFDLSILWNLWGLTCVLKSCDQSCAVCKNRNVVQHNCKEGGS